MFILGNILIAIGNILHSVIFIYEFIIFAAIIISWVRPMPSNDIIRMILSTIERLTQPVFAFLRGKLPASFFSSGIDFTPMILIFGLYLIDMAIATNIYEMGIRLKIQSAATSLQQAPYFQQSF